MTEVKREARLTYQTEDIDNDTFRRRHHASCHTRDLSKMLDAAQAGSYAFPAINVTSTKPAMRRLRICDSGSDGIIQVSTRRGVCLRTALKDMVLGGITLAEHDIGWGQVQYLRWAHTSLRAEKLEQIMVPLIQETARRRARGRESVPVAHVRR